MAQQQAANPAVVEARKQADTMYNLLMSRKDAIGALVPKHLTPERLVRGIMAKAARNPRLLECTPASLLNCVLIAANLGLELGRDQGGIHPVPFKNGKTGKYEVTPIPDYRGLMALAYNSGKVLTIEARAIYEKEKYEIAYGTDSHITHIPTLRERGELVAVYAMASLVNPAGTGEPVKHFVVLPLEDVNSYRDRSKSFQNAEKAWNGKQPSKDSTWHKDYLAMSLKTAVKRLVNWLPQSPETAKLHRAVEMDDRVESGEALSGLFDDVIETTAEDMGTVDEPDQSATRTDNLKSKLAKAAMPEPVPAQDGDPGPQSAEDEEPTPYQKFCARVDECQDAEQLNAFFNSDEANGYLNAMEKQSQEFAKSAYRKKRDGFKAKK